MGRGLFPNGTTKWSDMARRAGCMRHAAGLPTLRWTIQKRKPARSTSASQKVASIRSCLVVAIWSVAETCTSITMVHTSLSSSGARRAMSSSASHSHPCAAVKVGVRSVAVEA